MAAAKARGRVGGRKPGLSEEAIKKAKAAKQLFDAGHSTVEEIANSLRISRATFYRYIDFMSNYEKKEHSKQKQKI